MIKYELHNNNKLLIVKYVDSISKSDLISFFKFCLDNQYLTSLKEIVADYRLAKEVYTVEDLIEITEARKKIAKGFHPIKTIFLVSNPRDTVIALLYSDYYKDHSDVFVVSTVNTITEYLSFNITDKELKIMLDNPKFEYSQ